MDIFEQVAEMRHQEGLEKGVEKVVKGLLVTTRLSVEKIAAAADVPVTFVRKVKKRLSEK